MSIYTANQSGNLSTAATWDLVRNTPTIHASTNITVTTAGVKTVGFTAPNTTNAATGVWVYATTYPSSGRNWTATLEESGAATAAVATILQTDMPVTAGWIYFRLGTPYVYTTTSASAYKWIIKSTTANSGTVGADSGGANPAYLSSEDTTGSPTTTDTIWIGPHNCTGSAITVTVDGTAGDIRGSSSNQNLTKTVSQGVQLGGSLTDSLAILKWDTASSASLSVTGMTIVTDGGEIQMGTVATPYPAANTATYTSRQGAGGTQTGIIIVSGSTGKCIMQGASRTYYNTTYVSGTGVAASPLVVSDAVDWNVGDRIAITATSANATNYNETEYKFIITKNSSTSYVLSATSGGAESAFTYTHDTNAKVLLLTRNVVFTNSVANQNLFMMNSLSSGYINLDWAYIKGMGGSGGTPTVNFPGYSMAIGLSQGSVGGFNGNTAGVAGVDYCVFDTTLQWGLTVHSTIPQTFTGNIFCASQAGTASSACAGLGVGPGVNGHTFIDHWFIGNTRMGINYGGVNCIFTNPHLSANNTGGTASQGAFYLNNGGTCTITTPNIHANRISGFALNGTTNTIVTSGELGTKGINETVDVLIVANSANSILFKTTNVGSATLVSGHTGGAVGATLIAFDTLNNTTNNHIWYTEYGSAQSTGSGLSDTTVRSASTLNVRINAEDSTTGFKYEYKVLAVPGNAVSTIGFIERNAAFATDTCLVELFLPGSTVADASQTMATTVGSYLVYNLAAIYSGTVSRYATVRISARTTTASAYVYVADISNGTNHIIDLTTWDNGQPSPIMFEQLGDAAAVWAVATNTLTTTGTTGKALVDISVIGPLNQL